jgi:hypothetical protein
MPKSKKSESSQSEKSKPTSKQKATKDAKPKAAPGVVKAAKVELPETPALKKKPTPKPANPVAPVKSIAAKPAAKKPQPIVITTEEISLRAYYIAERRMAMGWPGDSSSDWVEAEAQIRREKSAS